jgi:hypothetical protein
MVIAARRNPVSCHRNPESSTFSNIVGAAGHRDEVGIRVKADNVSYFVASVHHVVHVPFSVIVASDVAEEHDGYQDRNEEEEQDVFEHHIDNWETALEIQP